ncbi:hypothetical protein P7H41_13320 [Vagococcus fluvialis]|uniref:phage tail assembly chaperone G n=1 Tax=Vagococcus fluvialis TaxID=2738 RepID=UPI00288D2066|nr:hypothetical protein [Vagococcus fluvialis]MDT2782924.1 hypothetical protein [Vagococcus fluvialis]
MEERTIKLSLRNNEGKVKEYFCDFVPQSKKIDYIRKEAELEKQNEGKETEIHDYDELQAEFVAGLFESDEVTKEAILNGLDSHDFKQVYDIVRYRVLGFSREEDEAAKKAMMEQLLVGQDSTTSK